MVLRGHTGSVIGVAFSFGHGGLLATASTDHTARIWDLAHPDAQPTVLRHGAGVTSVAFAPDGTHVATGSDDAVARVWDCDECGPIAKVIDLARAPRGARTHK